MFVNPYVYQAPLHQVSNSSCVYQASKENCKVCWSFWNLLFESRNAGKDYLPFESSRPHCEVLNEFVQHPHCQYQIINTDLESSTYELYWFELSPVKDTNVVLRHKCLLTNNVGSGCTRIYHEGSTCSVFLLKLKLVRFVIDHHFWSILFFYKHIIWDEQHRRD